MKQNNEKKKERTEELISNREEALTNNMSGPLKPAASPSPASTSKKDALDEQLLKQRAKTIIKGGKNIPERSYSKMVVEVTVAKEVVGCKGLGLKLNVDIVIGHEPNSPSYGILRLGDLIFSVNGIKLTEDQDKNTELLNSVSAGNHKLSIIRLKVHIRGRPKLPKSYAEQEGFDYIWVAIFQIRGINLGLELQEFEKKVFVIRIAPNSLGSMVLSVGDCILQIRGEMITTAQQVHEILTREVAKRGYCPLVLEVACQDNTRNAIRFRMGQLTGPETTLDLPLPKDIQLLAEVGVEAIKNTSKEPKSIYKDTESKKTKKTVSFNEKTMEMGIEADFTSSRLLVKVPPAKTLASELAMRAAMGGGGG